MSQDPPPLPEPEQPVSPSPLPPVTPPPAPAQADTRSQQVLQQLQQFWRQTQPILRAGSVRSLRFTIQSLEFLLEKLEPESPAGLSMPELPRSEQIGAGKVRVEATEPIAIPAAPKRPQQAQPGLSDKPKILGQVKSGWGVVLVRIRSLLPVTWNEKLSDLALTGAVAGALALLLLTTSALQPGKSSEVASKPIVSPASKQPAPSPTLPTPLPSVIPPPELSAPASEQPIAINLPTSTNSPITTPTPVISPQSPDAKVFSPEPLPKPLLNLTPEQSLIAAIENQVAEVTGEYADGLIQSIQANFRSSRLTIKVSNGWYDLSPTRQNRLATEMLKRSKDLDFSAIELTDREGTLLARSPVVGTEMVILQRSPQKPDSTPQ